jgi:group I intron endonuclease
MNVRAVYEISFADSAMRYIGSTVDLKSRSANHWSSLNAGTHANKFLQADYNKYGGSLMVISILEVVSADDSLTEREQAHIDSYPWRMLYNIMPAVREERINTGFRFTPTLRRYLQQHEKTQADLVEDVVRRTADFKRWENDD